MENGKWKMANPTLFVQKCRRRWLEAVCFLLPEGPLFGAPSPTHGERRRSLKKALADATKTAFLNRPS